MPKRDTIGRPNAGKGNQQHDDAIFLSLTCLLVAYHWCVHIGESAVIVVDLTQIACIHTHIPAPSVVVAQSMVQELEQQDDRRLLFFSESTPYSLQGEVIPLVETSDSDLDSDRLAVARDGFRVAYGGRSAVVRVYEYSSTGTTTSSWQQVGGDIVVDHSSMVLSADGSTVAVSIPESATSGTIRFTSVYQIVGGTWTQVGNTIDDSDRSGNMLLSANGNLLAISNNRFDFVDDSDMRNVRVYELQTDNTWELVGGEPIPNPDTRFLARVLETGGGVLTVALRNVNSPDVRLQVWTYTPNAVWTVVQDESAGIFPISSIQSTATRSTPCGFNYQQVEVRDYNRDDRDVDTWSSVADLVLNNMARYTVADDGSAVVAIDVVDGMRVYILGGGEDTSSMAGLLARLPRLFMERIMVLFQWPPRIFQFCGLLCPTPPPLCLESLSPPNFEGL